MAASADCKVELTPRGGVIFPLREASVLSLRLTGGGGVGGCSASMILVIRSEEVRDEGCDLERVREVAGR
jgi:hypothetical protein